LKFSETQGRNKAASKREYAREFLPIFVIDSDIKKPGAWYRIDQGARMTTGYVNEIEWQQRLFDATEDKEPCGTQTAARALLRKSGCSLFWEKPLREYVPGGEQVSEHADNGHSFPESRPLNHAATLLAERRAAASEVNSVRCFARPDPPAASGLFRQSFTSA
jgi:hypothetical protein